MPSLLVWEHVSELPLEAELFILHIDYILFIHPSVDTGIASILCLLYSFNYNVHQK